MKYIYESWSEVADDVCSGDGLIHRVWAEHHDDDCYPWQQGVHNMAQILDILSIPIPEDIDLSEVLSVECSNKSWWRKEVV